MSMCHIHLLRPVICTLPEDTTTDEFGTSENPVGLSSLSWSSTLSQPERNFMNYLVHLLWKIASAFVQQKFWVAFAALWPTSNEQNINFQIILHCTLIFETFKSHMEWSNSQHVSARTTTILQTTRSLNVKHFSLCSFTQSAGAVEYTDAPQQRRKNLPMNVLDMTINNLVVMFLWCRSFGECRVPLHCHCSQTHSGPEWLHLIRPYLWIKEN